MVILNLHEISCAVSLYINPHLHMDPCAAARRTVRVECRYSRSHAHVKNPPAEDGERQTGVDYDGPVHLATCTQSVEMDDLPSGPVYFIQGAQNALLGEGLSRKIR